MIRVLTHARYAALPLTIVFSFAAALSQWSRLGWDAVLEFAALAALSSTAMLWTRRTVLLVHPDGLTASGDLGGSRRGVLSLPWSRVRELHFGPGGAGEIGGLYAREGTWCSRCILPRLTEAQATEVIAAVARRYPSMLLSADRSDHIAISWPVSASGSAQAAVSHRTADVR